MSMHHVHHEVVVYAVEVVLLLSDCLQEFYHHQLRAGITELPRIFGMTASPINTAAKSESTMSKHIRKLMTLMDSKVVFISLLFMYNFSPFLLREYHRYT
jgi:endoribonuclease Dicer